MSLFGLASGTLWKAPERRTSKAGKPFMFATLRSGGADGDNVIWVKLFAFSDGARAELELLNDGDALSVQGSLRAEIYTPPSGEPRINLSISITSILPVKRRKRKQLATAETAPSLVPDYDDSVPF